MRRRAVPLLLAVSAALPGCGLGAGKEDGTARITVSRDFGAQMLAEEKPTVRGSDTVMRALQRSFRVRTRYGGGFVQAIDGLAGGRRGGRPVDWFYFVNGIEAPKGAAATKLHKGDRIRWDFRDWSAAQSVPAIVADFPEPFIHGQHGERFPTRLECAPEAEAACAEAERRLRAVGVVTGRSGLGTAVSENVLRVVVGPWKALRADEAARALERGPRSSGAFVKPARDGKSAALLDARGRVTGRLGAGSGFVAATRRPRQQPTWFVAGPDAAGALAAAKAMRPRALEGRFAAAVRGERVTSLPERVR